MQQIPNINPTLKKLSGDYNIISNDSFNTILNIINVQSTTINNLIKAHDELSQKYDALSKSIATANSNIKILAESIQNL